MFGVNTRIAVGATSTVDRELEIIGHTVKALDVIGDFNGQRGMRGRNIERTRKTFTRVGGTINAAPTPVEWGFWLKYLLGGTPSGTSYPLADLLPTFHLHTYDPQYTHLFSTVGITRGVITATPGQALTIAADVVGVGVTDTATGSLPGGLSVDTGSPFVISDTSTVTIDGNTDVQFNSYSMTVDNGIAADRWNNKTTLPAVLPTDRNLMLDIMVPWLNNAALYKDASGGVAFDIVFTNGTVSLEFSSSGFQYPKQSAAATGRADEVILPLNGRLLRKAGAAELTTALDLTP